MKVISKIALVIFILICTSACSQPVADKDETGWQPIDKYRFNQHIDYASEPDQYLLYHPDSLMKLAGFYIGTRYMAGGKTPQGFDCSGFAFYIYKQYNIYLPASSRNISGIGKKIKPDEAQPGDLIFFKGQNVYDSFAGHVGIVVSQPGEPVRFIHSSSSKGIRYDLVDENPYYNRRFMFIKRIVED